VLNLLSHGGSFCVSVGIANKVTHGGTHDRALGSTHGRANETAHSGTLGGAHKVADGRTHSGTLGSAHGGANEASVRCADRVAHKRADVCANVESYYKHDDNDDDHETLALQRCPGRP
jgi:hypothetical protein